MSTWSRIAEIIAPDALDRARGASLLEEALAGVPVERTQTALLRLSDGAIAAFYAGLEARAPAWGGDEEPRGQAWMADADFCYLNARASAIDGRPGTFLSAAKLLPAISSSAIHLAPFHPVHFDVIYAPESTNAVDQGLADARLSASGIGAEDQLRAFIEAARLLGKRVGYELLAFTAQFSRAVLERPELFRWIHVDRDRSLLADADPAAPYGPADRLRIAALVAETVGAAKAAAGAASLEHEAGEPPEAAAAKDKAYYAAIKRCVHGGLWPVPSHARGGAGVPAFGGYDLAGDYPVFAYRDEAGADIGADALGIVTPYCFLDGLPPNALPEASPDGLSLNAGAVSQYSGVFRRWNREFGFSFVVLDSVDEVLRRAGGALAPLADAPPVEAIAAAIAECRSGQPGAGILASRLGSEADAYAPLGVDAVIGGDARRRIDAPLVRESLAFYDGLAKAKAVPGAASSAARCALCFAVDIPSSGAPRFWGSSLRQLLGPERMRLRHALARFIAVGPGRRPLYEVMGFQDGSTGLYEASIATRGLDWADDASFAAGYAAIERLYARLRPVLDAGAIVERRVEDAFAWWQISGPSRSRLVIVAMSLETADGQRPGPVAIPIDKAWGGLEGTMYRARAMEGAAISATGVLAIDLEYLEYAIADLVPAYY